MMATTMTTRMMILNPTMDSGIDDNDGNNCIDND